MKRILTVSVIAVILFGRPLGYAQKLATNTAQKPTATESRQIAPAHRRPGPTQPNIIFILTDDQRWSALGYAGNPLVHTPEMDKLARIGTYFKKGMVTTPICAASRASILSGLYERTHRYTFQTGPIRDDYMKTAYPNVLKQAGYYTGFFGKLGVKYDKADALFDVIEDYDRNNKYPDQRGYFYKTLGKDTVHLTRYTGQKGIDFIKAASAKKPFCLSLSFSAPHAHDSAPGQYFYDEQTAHLLDNETIPPPALGDDKYFNAQPEAVRKGFNRLRWTWRFDTPEKYQRMVKGYYRMIAGVDLEIAKIRAQLKQQGLDKNTIIIVMGDNGYFLGERQLADKWLLYDNSVRVPLIIYDPRTPVHRDVDDMALNIDVPATIADLAGAKQPAAWHGKSLLPIVSGATKRIDRDTVLIEHLWEFKDIPPSEGVRTNRWKYFRYVNDKTLEELYDLSADPQEMTNLARNDSYKTVLNKLRGATDRLGRKYSDPYAVVPSGLMVNFNRMSGQVLPANQIPDFFWIAPTEAVFQSAYQVLVASSRANLDNNIGDVWNSGQVRGSQSANVRYAGTPLKPGMTCFWKVRIWDTSNRTGDYSVSQSFRVGPPGTSLAPPPSFEIERNAPQSFRKQSNGAYFADFGKDAFSTLELTYAAPTLDTLLVRLGEQLAGNQINRKPEGHIRYQEVKLPVQPGKRTYRLAIKPDQRNTKVGAVVLPDSFPVLLPFRYTEIERATEPLTANSLTRVAYFGYFDESQSHFSSSDTILNQVWDMCKYTIKATSFSGLYIDGDRERIPYEADAYLNQLSHYTTDREYGMARRTIEYFMQHPTWPTEWQLHVALMMYQDYMYTGNTELITRYYEPLTHKTLLELVREDGLISSESPKNTPAFMQKLGFTDPDIKLKDIVDWPPAQKDTGWKLATAEGERDGYVFTPINTVVNALFYKNMDIMAEFAHILNKPDDEIRFRMAALKAKQAINSTLFDEKTGAYVDGEGTNHSSLHANMMVLAFDITPERHKKSVADFIKSRGMACSVYGSQYLLESLYNAGEADYALKLMTATTDRSWWNMIRSGSTVAWEAWDTKYKPNLDWNHAWGATPANIISRNMWGIQPAIPGGSIVSIRPQLGSLQTSSILVPMLKGTISASYVRKSKLNQAYTIELPANVSAELELLSSPEDTITVNGEKVDTAFKTIRLSPGKNVVELIVNTF
ncbi:sulfatase-like hydrolase/transferase [Spirosoma spitsbergense]|uniref:sulfatase-like hydrolase/transferase n=1 Tax=Spirosoma spitsbergense TaxID=431554 RepID=UPI0003700EE4|nr:sulfatase-like hydrolase/transferase [Spirosoma spitsbergense]